MLCVAWRARHSSNLTPSHHSRFSACALSACCALRLLRCQTRNSAGAASPAHCRGQSAAIPAPCRYVLRRRNRPTFARGRGSGARRAAPCLALGARAPAGSAPACRCRSATRLLPDGDRSPGGSRRARGQGLLSALHVKSEAATQNNLESSTHRPSLARSLDPSAKPAPLPR